MGRAELTFYECQKVEEIYLLELCIWHVEDKRYSNGVKYSLILVNTFNAERVLMDNHFPKGDHYHLNSAEFPYEYSNEAKLIDDFKVLVHKHLGVKL